MAMNNPLLDFTDLPLFDRITPENVAPAVDSLLADAETALQTVTAPEFPADWMAISKVLDVASERFSRAWGAVGHLNAVADTPELRAAYNEAMPRVTAFWTRLGSDERLYAKYKDKGLRIVGFPANEFLAQEPGTNEEIQQFCRLNYGVEFPVYSKIVVKGEGIHPLYSALTAAIPEAASPGGLEAAKTAAKNLIRAQRNGSRGPGEITWNFEKFLVGRNGQVVNRFAPDTEPDAPEVVQAIETELAKPAEKK